MTKHAWANGPAALLSPAAAAQFPRQFAGTIAAEIYRGYYFRGKVIWAHCCGSLPGLLPRKFAGAILPRKVFGTIAAAVRSLPGLLPRQFWRNNGTFR